MDYRQIYEAKLTTPEEAVKVVKNGDWVDYSQTCSYPRLLDKALSDRSALREYVEADPALEGLDRLYVQEVVDAMLRMHSDILTQFTSDDEEE